MPYTKNYDLDTDTTLGGDNASDYVAASQRAIKNYVDNHSGSSGANTDLSNLTATGEAHFLKNTATGTESLTIAGDITTATRSTNIGIFSRANGENSVAIGSYSRANGENSVAIGCLAYAGENKTIQLGYGQALNPMTFCVGFDSQHNYQLLNGSTGLIPDARISSNIARTSQIPSTTGFLENTATGTSSLTLLGTSSTANSSINIGVNSQATGSDGVAIGVQANANSNFATAIGYGAKVTGSYGIQLGYGTNSTGHFYVGFNNSGSPQNYKMLDRSTGLIPDERLNNLKFDGQWVQSYKILVNGANVTSITTYSLSSYLPNDSNNYEVVLSMNAFTGSTSGNSIACYGGSDLLSFTSSNFLTNAILITQARTRTSSTLTSAGSCIIPVGSGRSVKLLTPTNILNVDWSKGTITAYLVAYRRIGTNT